MGVVKEDARSLGYSSADYVAVSMFFPFPKP